MNEHSRWETPVVLALSLMAVGIAGWIIGFTAAILHQMIAP